MSCLKYLGIETEAWHPLLVFIITQKLPHSTHGLWEQTFTAKTEVPAFASLKTFLFNRFLTLEALQGTTTRGGGKPVQVANNQGGGGNQAKSPPKGHKAFHATSSNTTITCPLCNGSHWLRQCEQFLAYSVEQRFQLCKNKKFCINCLANAHTSSKCPSKFNCRICKQRHHTLLHITQNQNQNLSPGASNSTNVHSNFASVPKKVVLATALINIHHNGDQHTIRA